MPHLNLCMQCPREVANQIPKVHPLLGGEVDGQATAVEIVLDPDDLHGQFVFRDLRPTLLQHLLFSTVVIRHLCQILSAGPTHHRLKFLVELTVENLCGRDSDPASFLPPSCLDNHHIAQLKLEVGRIEIVDLAYPLEANSYNGWHEVMLQSGGAKNGLTLSLLHLALKSSDGLLALLPTKFTL